MKYWVAPGIYQDPKRGTLRWRHGHPPTSKTALKRINMYVIDDTVGSSLGAVILAAKQERETKWKGTPQRNDKRSDKDFNIQVWEKVEWLRNLPPSSYWGDLSEVTPAEMYNLIIGKGANEENFLGWMSLRDKGKQSDPLSDSMESLKLADPPTIPDDAWNWDATTEEEVKKLLEDEDEASKGASRTLTQT